jgi:hypothetical protein
VYRPAIGLVAIGGGGRVRSGTPLRPEERDSFSFKLATEAPRPHYKAFVPKYQPGAKGGLVGEGVSLAFLLLVHRAIVCLVEGRGGGGGFRTHPQLPWSHSLVRIDAKLLNSQGRGFAQLGGQQQADGT